MNARSSRSHTVFKIAIKSSKSEEAKKDAEMLAQIDDEDEEFHAIGNSNTADGSAQYSSLTLIDLAGSERQKNTKASAKP